MPVTCVAYHFTCKEFAKHVKKCLFFIRFQGSLVTNFTKFKKAKFPLEQAIYSITGYFI